MLNAVRTPRILLPSVWPLPRSLATTGGISGDFFSSPYLDVSVQAVPHIRLFDSPHVDRFFICRVSPFGYPRVAGCFRLTVAFRRSLRPSSAPGAKAFPLCSFQLDHFSHALAWGIILCSNLFGSLGFPSTIKYCSFYPKIFLPFHIYVRFVQFSRYKFRCWILDFGS